MALSPYFSLTWSRIILSMKPTHRIHKLSTLSKANHVVRTRSNTVLNQIRHQSTSIRQKNDIMEIRSCQGLRNGVYPNYVGAPHSKLHHIKWKTSIENIYMVKKPWNVDVRDAMIQFISFLLVNYPLINIIVSEDVADELFHEIKQKDIESLDNPGSLTLYTGNLNDIVNKTDLILTLGGDGTILRAVSTFSNCNVPPVLSFALGTLGFLLPFDFKNFRETFKMVVEGEAKALHRSRLECHVIRKRDIEIKQKKKDTGDANGLLNLEELREIKTFQQCHYQVNHETTMIHAMNDISLHRGSQPNLISLDIFIDNEFLTTTTADGIAFSTPTGSTAYSLSAGGSITHPLVPCILLTPICPRSLSFRPLILPSTSHIMIKLSETNRNVAIKLNIDGIPQSDLKPGDQIHVVSENGTIYIPGKIDAPYTLTQRNEFDKFIEPGSSNGLLDKRQSPPTPTSVPDSKVNLKEKGIWCIARSENDWTKDINELLGFNSSFRGSKKKE